MASAVLSVFMLAGTVSDSAREAEAFILKAVVTWPKTASEYRAFTIFTDSVEQLVAKKAPGKGCAARVAE